MLYSLSVFDSNARIHWLNQGHVDECKSNVPLKVNISNIFAQPLNMAVALSRLRAGKFSGKIGSTSSRELSGILGKQNRCSPREQSLSVYCLLNFVFYLFILRNN